MSERLQPSGIREWVRELVAPRRKDRAVPLGRAAIASIATAAAIFFFYTLVKDAVRIPFVSGRYAIAVELPYGAGLDPKDSPAVGVAGTQQGRVTDVRYEDGKAVATLELNPDVRGKVFRDARVDLRPINIVNILALNVVPGDPDSGPLPEGGRIPASRTTGYVAVDKLTGVLDPDTRAYAQILVGEAARALEGRSGDLAHAFRRLGPLTDSSREVTDALAQRRRLVTRLVDDLDVIFSTLAERRDQLASVVDSASEVLSVTAARERELAAAVQGLPPTLAQARATIAETRRLSGPLGVATDQLTPVARELAPALDEGREVIPSLRRVFEDAELLARRGGPPVRDLRAFSTTLERSAAETVPALGDVDELLVSLSDHAGGFAQLSDLSSGVTSTADANGGTARVVNVEFEPAKPENFGLGASAAKRSGNGHSPLEKKLARAFDALCKDVNELACLARQRVPGLPPPGAADAPRGSGTTLERNPRSEAVP